MRQARFIFPIIFLAVVLTVPLAAQYRFDAWTTENGLPQNSVNAIAQTRDGYIWFATFGGLVRFDGLKFKIFNTINAPIFKTNRLISLTEAFDGRLLIGAQNGALISYQDDVFTSLIEKPVAQRTPLEVVCALKNGEIWLFSPTGLEKYTPDAAGGMSFEHIEIPGEGAPRIGGIVEDEAGSVWVSTSFGLYRFQNGAPANSYLFKDSLTLPADEKGVPLRQQVAIFTDRQKRLWLNSADFLARFENGRIVPIIQKRSANFRFAENTDGTFFLYSEDKIYRFDGDRIGETLIAGSQPTPNFRSMISDREGNLWAGTNGHGLLRYKLQTARTYAKADGLTDSYVNFVFEDRDRQIWLGADGLYKYRDGKFEIVPGTAGRMFYSAFQSRDGVLWLKTPEGFVTYEQGRFADVKNKTGIDAEAVYEDHRGAFYFVVADGLIVECAGRREHFSAAEGFAKSTVQKIFEDRDGGIWLAMSGGASRFKDNSFTNYSGHGDLSNDNVRDIYEDADGALWFGTYGGGLNRLKDGKFFAITTREGMNEDIVSRIIVDEKDNFWMLGNRGVSVISRAALNDLADGKTKTIACESYGVSDGMQNSEGNGGNYPTGLLAADGRLWFPSIKGAIVIEPAPGNLPPPPVYIEDVFLSGRQLAAASEIEIAPGAENLEIHYTGLNYTKPEQVKFKYMLEGFDQDWIEVGTRRAAYYTQIPAGWYRFMVTASTTNGVWNERPAIREVVVLSNPVWKKWWFILSVSLLAILAVVIFYRLRLRQLEKIRRQQQEFSRQLIASQERERKRIAGELHDGLGQTLLIIKNRAFLGRKAGTLEAANEQLGEISASSGEAIDQAREIAYYLRPSQLERFGLTSALEEMMKQAAEASEIAFEFHIDSLEGVFSPEEEINFYRIVQESVNNIMKHSAAARAEVRVTQTPGLTELLIADDGRGLQSQSPNIQKRSGFGLSGIEERVRILGGKLSIKSEAGQGVKVAVTIEK